VPPVGEGRVVGEARERVVVERLHSSSKNGSRSRCRRRLARAVDEPARALVLRVGGERRCA
jgi:hypothetical protein